MSCIALILISAICRGQDFDASGERRDRALSSVTVSAGALEISQQCLFLYQARCVAESYAVDCQRFED